MSALTGLLRKEAYHILRDRRTLAVLILLPIVQVVLFGFSIRTDVKDVRLAIVDPTPDPTTLAIRNRFAATGAFRTVAVLENEAELERLFQTDTAQVAIEFGPHFAESLAAGDAAQVLVVADATEPNSGTGRLNYVEAVIQSYAANELRGRGIRIESRVRSRFNPTRQSANLFVPGLVGSPGTELEFAL